MNKKAKIVVLHMKELVYTGLFLVLGILFALTAQTLPTTIPIINNIE